MGLKEDLDLKGNNFSNAATAFWIAYLVAEPVNCEFSGCVFDVWTFSDVLGYQPISSRKCRQPNGSEGICALGDSSRPASPP